MSKGRQFPELNAMLGEVLTQIPGPFGPAHPDAQLVRNRVIQQVLISKCIDAAEELLPDFAEVLGCDDDPEVIAACSEFALAAGETKWPGLVALLRQLGNDEGSYWKRIRAVVA